MSNVSFVLVYVDDVSDSEAFYASILGRGAIESSPTFAMLPAAPGLMFGLWKRDGVKPAPADGAGRSRSRQRTTPRSTRSSPSGARGCRHRPGADVDGVRLHVVALDPGGRRLRVFAPAAN